MIKYTGFVKDGKLTIAYVDRFKEDVRGFEGKHIVLTLDKKKRSRTNPQNSYYWAVIVPMIQQGFKDLGERLDIKTVHEFLLSQFSIKEVVNNETGEIFTMTKRSKDMTTSEFMDHIAQCQQFAAEKLSVVIPDPNSQVQIDYSQLNK